MLIRKMTFDDIAAAVLIEKDCFSLPWSEKSFKESLERDDTLFLVCEEQIVSKNVAVSAAVTGYIGMYLSFDEGNITNVAVSPSYRKKGYGEALVSAAKEIAKEMQIEKIFLEVRVSNIPAISLYEKMGFESLGVRKNFYEHPQEDASIMCVCL